MLGTNHRLKLITVFNAPKFFHKYTQLSSYRYFIEKKPPLGDLFYADKTFLPLLRRRAKTLRPPTVFIRALKPWTFWCFLLLGWYVLFIIEPPPNLHLYKWTICLMIISDNSFKVNWFYYYMNSNIYRNKTLKYC